MKKIIGSFLISLFVICLIGCNDDSDNSNPISRIQLKLVDAPGDYLEVNVEIIDILYNDTDGDEGWVSIGTPDGDPLEVDLTELVSGNSLLLADEELPSGSLNQIRLVLSDNNWLVIEEENGEASEPIHLDTPSAQQSGLKLKLNTELEPGFTYSFILDWDVQKSVVKAGNSGKYNLKPVIDVIAEVNSGSIEGTVVGKLDVNDVDPIALENVVVEVYDKDDLVNSVNSTLTDVNGYFIFQGLKAGNYVIKINSTGYVPYETPSGSEIDVVVGAVEKVETIELVLE